MDMASSPEKWPFHFEKFWLTHPEFQENHHQWWEDADHFTWLTDVPLSTKDEKISSNT
jgi:hypothetical protein